MSLLSANLHAFLAIVRLGTVHAASASLLLTQTAVTQRIRALEKDLGTTLFLRSRKGMRLTPEGEALLRYCQGAEQLEGQALAEISGAADDRPAHVTIAGPTSVMTARIARQCVHLYSEWPCLHLNFVITDSMDRLNLVRSGQVSLAVVSPDRVPNEMDGKRLRPDRYLLVASPRWKGRRLADLLETERIIDFDADDQTTLNYLKKFGLLDQLKRPRLFVNDNEVIAQYFSQGIGFGTLTAEVAKPHLEAGRLIALNGAAALEDPLALAWYPRPEMPRYLKAIIDAIK